MSTPLRGFRDFVPGTLFANITVLTALWCTTQRLGRTPFSRRNLVSNGTKLFQAIMMVCGWCETLVTSHCSSNKLHTLCRHISGFRHQPGYLVPVGIPRFYGSGSDWVATTEYRIPSFELPFMRHVDFASLDPPPMWHDQPAGYLAPCWVTGVNQ